MKSQTISKTDFLRYLECPLYAWLWKNRPELIEGQEDSYFSQQGQQAELVARGLFEKGEEVQGYYEEGAKYTKELMDKGVNVIYQATLISGGYLARSDILVRKEDGWHLYEVKSSTKVKKEHTPDLCFQTLAFQEAGIELRSINLVLINNKYIYQKNDGLELDKLFFTEDMTEKVRENFDECLAEIKQAYKVLMADQEPAITSLKKALRGDMPDKLEEYYWKNIPDYSIYDISGIGKPKLDGLCKEGILKIEDVPNGFLTAPTQIRQAELTKNKETKIDKNALKMELDKLEFPLYFLDYETHGPAIPVFDQTHSWQNIPFQYSLHVLEELNGELKHFEFLHTEKTNPIPSLVENLCEQIGDHGSVVVWNEGFEGRCNEGMMNSVPEFLNCLKSINSRFFDLMIIFKNIYADYRCKGSMSLKNVLPVIVPELDYKELDIKHGGEAMIMISKLINNELENSDKAIVGLKEYCKLDTLAMVRIYEFLLKVIG